MSLPDFIAGGLLLAGCFFYVAGTAGLLRFPDVFTRLHALTKADNLGLLLVCLGLAVNDRSLQTTGLLLVIWLLGLLAATVSCHLIARRARHAQTAARGEILDAPGDSEGMP